MRDRFRYEKSRDFPEHCCLVGADGRETVAGLPKRMKGARL